MTPAEIELLIRRVLNEGVHLQGLVYVVLVGISALCGLAGSYLGAYAKKRGENLATKADFAELLRQVRLQTRETEEIKSEIAKTSWVHQQRWDFKREVYSQLLAVLEEIRQKTYWLTDSLNSWDQSRHREALELYGKHMFERGVLDKLISYRGMAGMILSQQALAALDDLSLQFDEIARIVLGSQSIDEALSRISASPVGAVVDATKIAYNLVRDAANNDLLDNRAAATAYD
jgi:hypothetical protein